jgi:chaperonin GroES
MMQATNNFVFLIRDDIETEKSGFIIPGQDREKPHEGTVVSIGDRVQDKNIQKSKGKKAVFHKGIGFEIELDNQVYLVLMGDEIIAVK